MNPFPPVRLSLWKTLPLLLAFLSLMSCPSPGYTGGDENEILPQSISIVGNNALPKNGTTYLTAIVEPVTAANRTVSWSSSDENAVSVNQHGKVTVSDSAQVGSEVTITVSSAAGDIKEPFLLRITSDYVAAAGVNLFPPRLYLPQGGTGILAAQILPENASDQSISWSVDHEEIELTTQGLELHVAVPDNLAPGEYTVTAGRDYLTASAVIEILPVGEEEYTVVTAAAIYLNDLEGDPITSLEVENGGNYRLKAGITPPDATFQEVSWSSSHPSFVSVSPLGFVTVAQDTPVDTEIILTLRTLAGGKSSQVVLKTPSLRIYHVKSESSGTEDGSSWDNAMGSLQAAMNNAEGRNAEIWVAAGTYVPAGSPHGATPIAVPGSTLPSLSSETLYYFSLRSGVEIYGGFAGTETERSQRDIEANITIFSGDRGDNDVHDPAVLPANDPIANIEDNVHHVFFNPYYFKGEAVGTIIRDVVIDGVVIQGGAARMVAGEDSATLDFGSGATDTYSAYSQGSGLYLEGLRVAKNKMPLEEYLAKKSQMESKRASITLRNVTFQRNQSGDNKQIKTTGAALFFQNVDALLENVDFKENYTLGKVAPFDDSLSGGGGAFAAYHSKISYTKGLFEGNVGSNSEHDNGITANTASLILAGAGMNIMLDGLVFRNNGITPKEATFYDVIVGGVSDLAVIKNSVFHDFTGGVPTNSSGNYPILFSEGIYGKVFLINSVFYNTQHFIKVVGATESNMEVFLINSVIVDENNGYSLLTTQSFKIINSIIDMAGTVLRTPITGTAPHYAGSLLGVGNSILNVKDGEIKFPHSEVPGPPAPPYFSQLWFEEPAFSDRSNPPGPDGIFGSADDGFRLAPGHNRKGLFVRANNFGDVFYSADKIRWYDDLALTNQVSPSGEILNERDFNGDLWDGQPGIGYVKPQSGD